MLQDTSALHMYLSQMSSAMTRETEFYTVSLRARTLSGQLKRLKISSEEQILQGFTQIGPFGLHLIQQDPDLQDEWGETIWALLGNTTGVRVVAEWFVKSLSVKEGISIKSGNSPLRLMSDVIPL